MLKNFIISMYLVSLLALLTLHIPVVEEKHFITSNDKIVVPNYNFATINQFFIRYKHTVENGISFTVRKLNVAALLYFLFVITIFYLLIFFTLKIKNLV